MVTGVVPQTSSVDERAAICALCRDHLLLEHGTPRGVYLDGHRDAPRILSFFLRKLWPAEISVRVHFYDCFKQAELGEAAEELAYVDLTWGAEPVDSRCTLYVYNHTDSTGHGYHFDALVRAATRGKDVRTQAQPAAGLLGVQGSAARTQVERFCEPPKPEAPSVDEVLEILGDFFRSCGASCTLTRRDVAAVVEAGYDEPALTESLDALLQAGLAHAVSGQHPAQKLVDQWRAYWAVRTEGAGSRWKAKPAPMVEKDTGNGRSLGGAGAVETDIRDVPKAKEAGTSLPRKRTAPTEAQPGAPKE